MLKIGEKIKALRKAQDVTWERLSDYLNISYQAVSKWGNGLALHTDPPYRRVFCRSPFCRLIFRSYCPIYNVWRIMNYTFGKSGCPEVTGISFRIIKKIFFCA